MNPQLRQAIKLASSRKWTPSAPRQTAGERTASAIARAANNPVRTGFLWSAGAHIADIAFGLVRMVLMLAIVAGLLYGTVVLLSWNQIKREAKPTATPSTASKQTKKADNAARGYTSESERAAKKP